jgi:hypothetical protein
MVMIIMIRALARLQGGREVPLPAVVSQGMERRKQQRRSWISRGGGGGEGGGLV